MSFTTIIRCVVGCFGSLAGVVLLVPLAQAYYPPYSALVIDADTGRVLFERNADEYRHPASLTKMMTLYMVFDALRHRRLHLRQLLWVSPEATQRPPSKLGLRSGDAITVEEAVLALVTRSANDAAATIAENLGGSESTFARLMTLKARSLGMTSTTFRNASGLPDPFQVTTARDMYRLARALQTDFPQYYRYFSTPEFYFRGRRYRNHNHLLDDYLGADGIKTGYIRASGYNLVASAQRSGRRVIGVVFGGESARARDEHMRGIMDVGFAALGVGSEPYRQVAYGNYPSRLPSARSQEAESAAAEQDDDSADSIAWSAPGRPGYSPSSTAVQRSSPAPGYITRSVPVPPADSTGLPGTQAAVTRSAPLPPTDSTQAVVTRSAPLPPADSSPGLTNPQAVQSSTVSLISRPAPVSVTQRRAGELNQDYATRGYSPRSASVTAQASATLEENEEDAQSGDSQDFISGSARVAVRENTPVENGYQVTRVYESSASTAAWESDDAENTRNARPGGRRDTSSGSASVTRNKAAEKVAQNDTARAAALRPASATRRDDSGLVRTGAAQKNKPAEPGMKNKIIPATLQKNATQGKPTPAKQPPPWQVQVGAFSQLTAAKQRASEAQQAVPGALVQQRSAILPLSKSGKTLYRVYFKVFDQKQAGNVCQTLKRKRIDCFPVPPTS